MYPFSFLSIYKQKDFPKIYSVGPLLTYTGLVLTAALALYH